MVRMLPAGDTARSAPPFPTGTTLARAALGGTLAALVAGSAVAASGPIASVLALLLLVLGPTASRLDRRLALNLALVFGWVPAAAYLPPSLGPDTAAVVTISFATGMTVAAALMGVRLTPVVRRRDLTIAAGGLLAALVALPLRSPGTPERALAMLSTGIDNSYHYTMYLERRLSSAGSGPLASAADATGFAFNSYPQWFHRMLTVLGQVAFGQPGPAPVKLVRYAQLQWVVFVATVVMVTAALLQALPRTLRPVMAIPAFAVAWSLLLGVPGSLNLIQGHLSFLLAASAPAVMFLLVVTGRFGAAVVVALIGLVLVTASWLLLLPLAAAALVAPAVRTWSRQRVSVRWVLLAAFAAGGAGAFVLFVLPWVTGAGVAAVLRDGTVPRVGLPTTLVLLVGPLVLLVVRMVRSPASGLEGHVVVILVGDLVLAAVGGYLLRETGELTYYFWKLGLGTLLVALLVTTHAVVTWAAEPGRVHAATRRSGVLTAGIVGLAAVLGLGSVLQDFTAPSAAWAVITPVSLATLPGSGQAGDVTVPLRLAASLAPSDAAAVRLLATRDVDMNAAHASEWFHALSHSSTVAAVSVDDGVYDLAEDTSDTALAVSLARSTLARPDGRVVLTDQALYHLIVRSVPPDEARRVTWFR